jgi:5-oxoprolinase (ATP-hydrolysing) subunit A
MSATRSIDLNADVGESYGRWQLGDDDALIPHLSSANVACGAHAGDPLTLRRTVAMCVAHHVAIGAQVSYPDLVGFGRRAMDLGADELTAEVLYQLAALDGLARVAGDRVRYLKPHGALYHRVLDDVDQASAVVAAATAWPEPIAVLTMPGGALAELANTAGLQVVAEGFADRAYDDDGRLVSRRHPDAVLTGPAVTAQARRLSADPKIGSLCVHGDTPGASELMATVRAALGADGVDIVAPWR